MNETRQIKKKHSLLPVYIEIVALILCCAGVFYLHRQNGILRAEIRQTAEKLEEIQTQTDDLIKESENARKEIEILKENSLEKEYELWLKRMEQLQSAID